MPQDPTRPRHQLHYWPCGPARGECHPARNTAQPTHGTALSIEAYTREDWKRRLFEDRIVLGTVIVIGKVPHAGLQQEEWVERQMPNGFGPVFSIDRLEVG